MSKFVPSRKVLQLIALAVLVAGAAIVLDGCKEQTPAANAPAATPAPVAQVPVVPATEQRSKEQAMNALMALPELKVWSERLDKESHGKVHGALIEYSQAPKVVEGKRYWQFSFVENGSEAAHRWESFLVAQDGDDILIDDDSTGKTLTLEQWRKERHPMDRTSADVIGG
jgi:hypothetical protein